MEASQSADLSEFKECVRNRRPQVRALFSGFDVGTKSADDRWSPSTRESQVIVKETRRRRGRKGRRARSLPPVVMAHLPCDGGGSGRRIDQSHELLPSLVLMIMVMMMMSAQRALTPSSQVESPSAQLLLLLVDESRKEGLLESSNSCSGNRRCCCCRRSST